MQTCRACHGYGCAMEHARLSIPGRGCIGQREDCGGRLNMRLRCSGCDGTGSVPATSPFVRRALRAELPGKVLA